VNGQLEIGQEQYVAGNEFKILQNARIIGDIQMNEPPKYIKNMTSNSNLLSKKRRSTQSKKPKLPKNEEIKK
jgi:hypothetical protein